MDKKFNFQDQPLKAKIIYGVVAGVLCITAIVVGIVTAASRKNDIPDTDDTPPVVDETPKEDDPKDEPENETPKKLAFVSPLVGKVNAKHSVDTPVFSATLGEWRIHKGIDITTDENAEVFAAERGSVSRIYSDPLLGKTVEITHDGGIVTKYSNLASTVNVKLGDTVESGALLGTVGDSSISELAEEPHLHFEMLVNGTSVNPLDYLTEDTLKVSLGISGN